jgi:glycosyltransferase involved in cell wall biosynthesis
LKVALYVHCFYPKHFYGTEAYTLAVAKHLQSLGHEPTVVTAIFPGEEPQPRLVEEYEWEGVPVLSIDKNAAPHTRVRDTYDQPSLRTLHERILRRLDPDIVHVCHLVNHTTALLDVVAALGLPAVATLTDFFGFCYTNKLEAIDGALCNGPNASRTNCIACHLKAAAGDPRAPRAIRALATHGAINLAARWLAGRAQRDPQFTVAGFRPADLIERPAVLERALKVYRAALAPTLFLKQAYEANGFPAPLVLSHFGIDIDRTAKPAREPGGVMQVGYIGQIAPHKGVHILIDALRAANRPNLSLTIWGPHDQDPAYYRRLQAASQGLAVSFGGTFPTAEIPRVMAGLDFLAIPSTWYENSPLILLQALATHTPVIVSDVLGLTEFVEDGRNGFHFRRGDAGALTALLQRIADSEGLAQQMSVDTEYPRSSRRMVGDLADVYRQALTRARSRAP